MNRSLYMYLGTYFKRAGLPIPDFAVRGLPFFRSICVCSRWARPRVWYGRLELES